MTSTRIYHKANDFHNEVLAHCQFPGLSFDAPSWLHNPHLQILRTLQLENRLTNLPYFESEPLTLTDGGKVGLSYWQPKADAKAMILVLPTICGCSTSTQLFLQELRKQLSWPVVVLDRRGHNRPFATPKFNTMGCVQDTSAQIEHIHQRFPNTRKYLIGLSAGSGLLVRYLGEASNSHLVTAGVAVCPAYDIELNLRHIHPLYDRYMLRRLKQYFLQPYKKKFGSNRETHFCEDARSVQEFHDRQYAFSGYTGKDKYYQGSNPMVVARNIRHPLLTINTVDDPVCPPENIDYKLFTEDLNQGMLLLSPFGSHCGFRVGRWGETSWLCDVIGRYFRFFENE